MKLSKTLLLACAFAMTSGIAMATDLPPIKPVAHVDLSRFMGDWYVVATIPTRFEKSACNAVWGVQVFWPIKAQYVVAWLKSDYSQVIVARDARDYTWVMARTPTISK